MPPEAARVTHGVRRGVRDGTRPDDGAGPRERGMRAGPGHDDAGPRTEHLGRGADHDARADHNVPRIVPTGVAPATTGPDRSAAEAVPAAVAVAVAVPSIARPAVHAEVRARAD